MINSFNEIKLYMKENGLNLVEAVLELEASSSGCSCDEIYNSMSNRLADMRKSTKEIPGSTGKTRIVENDAIKMRKYRLEKNPLSGDIISRASEISLSVSMLNATMGRIVAAPTAGSCGILPGLLFAWEEKRNIHDDKKKIMVEGLIVAACIGQIIANKATLAGSEGGCQAECGSATAMGSAALVWMECRDPHKCFEAASICLKSIMGLVCDPVAGLVEVPCIKRNGTLVSMAVLSADMAISGVKSIIPFDEIVDAMYLVGKAIPSTLKETGEGGLAITPTGLSIQDRLKKEYAL
ncbi:MAG: L-serine ammonia-lyase, iron-sulfur-dependent, subunit alpha [Atribacterota bacterium]|nr:L-serine ammonia-lyase, iron-sulfur-dependent, subunit alpha [Atribacterota bacterium]MDD4765357.1 L-serine ammonia-lyase, iron-sulfur-dependent, subunit alpha [Atribacterota bacterium]MDD5636079.1 L-serine ammonia-lyase, iron-sulfur-dependent, subunit alpha [Atribacterota bacterium]MDI9596765.1 L-serine ammonia-lyase, iron-sulfur-dependent, subunit alpha [Atribacterota bacterium]